jgi:hypothetical protein
MTKRIKTTKASEISEAFLKKVKSVTAKRPRTVIEHILKYGYVTTEELAELYGYRHAPRAARDVLELGIPLETQRVEGKGGRKIAAYCFGDPSKVRGGIMGGRKAWPKELKNQLVSLNGERCEVCSTIFEKRYLQIDHRIPYEIGGDPKGNPVLADYMLLCGSCNRAKSWSCEHCKNWENDQIKDICRTCYWSSPSDYKHISLRLIRRLDITWTEKEVSVYKRLLRLSKYAEKDLPAFVKECLKKIAEDIRI